MNSYQEIDRLLGAPLNQIQKPKVPFKWTTGKVVLVGGAIAVFLYGAYTLCKDVKSVFSKKESDDDETSWNSKFKFKNPNEKNKDDGKSSKKK
jgi:hypothetical protein